MEQQSAPPGECRGSNLPLQKGLWGCGVVGRFEESEERIRRRRRVQCSVARWTRLGKPKERAPILCPTLRTETDRHRSCLCVRDSHSDGLLLSFLAPDKPQREFLVKIHLGNHLIILILINDFIYSLQKANLSILKNSNSIKRLFFLFFFINILCFFNIFFTF